jgi:DNA-binding transcriptional MerR regulator
MTQQLTIGQLSTQSGVPTKTIRFYEEIGLIAPAERTENKYRTYPLSSVEELSLIKNARDLGLPIPEIKKLMLGCIDGDCEHSQQYVNKEVGDYIGVLEAKIRQLTHLKSQLQLLRKQWVTNPLSSGPYCCNVLGQIAHLPKGGEQND